MRNNASSFRCSFIKVLSGFICTCLFNNTLSAGSGLSAIDEPYRLEESLVSRSISFENPTGAPGQGGRAAGKLGPGRKGSPAKQIGPSEKIQLCDISGSGTI